DDFSAIGIDGPHHLVVLLAREGEHAVADDDGRRIAGADVDLPSLRQTLGPRSRLGKGPEGAVAVGPAPLRPVGVVVLSGSDGGQSDGATDREKRARRKSHRVLTSVAAASRPSRPSMFPLPWMKHRWPVDVSFHL